MAAIVIQCVLAIIAPRGAGGRLSGMFDHDANSLALLANILLPLLAWYMLDKRNRLRWLAVAAVPIALMTLVLASSRGGFLAFGAMAASTVFLASRRAPKPLRRLFPIAATMALVGVALAPADVTQRVTAMIDGSDYNYTSDGGRMAIWKRGMGYAFSNPIFGVGFGNFGAAEGSSEIAARYAREGRGFVRNTAHSTYVEVLAEVGLIGGGAFILLLFLTIRDLFRAARSANRTRDPDAVLVGAFGIAVLGYAVSFAFLSYAWFSAGYILYGVAYGYIDGLDRPRHHRGLPASVMAHPRGGPKRPVQVAPPLTTARVYRPSP
jgi:O-antigen ligase